MDRVGIFIDALQGSIPAFFRERIASYVEGLPQVVFCRVEENLTSPESLSRMAKGLEEGRVDRVLIVGGSPKLYETSFQKWGHPLPFNPYLLTVANIREQVLWTTGDEEQALEKAKGAITKALRTVSASQPIETESLPLKPEILVLGGGITGISIAQALAKSGVHVFLLEDRKITRMNYSHRT